MTARPTTCELAAPPPAGPASPSAARRPCVSVRLASQHRHGLLSAAALGKYYLVDSGYLNRTGYLAPFKEQRYHIPGFQGAPPQNMHEKFNHLHSSLRNAIKRAFGVLKMKWLILLSIPFYPYEETQSKIITASMCLHNFIRDSKLYDDHFDTIERSSYIHEDSSSYVGGNASSSSDDVMCATR